MPAESPLRDGRDTDFYLIETMRREPDTGIVRFDLHMQRLEDSAKALGFHHDRQHIDAALAALPASAGQQRIRLTLARDGLCTTQATPFQPIADGTVWTLRIGATRLDSSDQLLRYKSSRRGVFDAARAEFPGDAVQEVLLLNERDELCEGTITSLYVDLDDGPLHTPPLSCGLLASVLRQSLLASGKACETVLRPEDLARAKRIFVGNSLRDLIPARLAASPSQ